ncbi:MULTISPECIES: hypothetical protein [unclassified Pseudomonas]|uniref:hypothetical protein n=1 Tax=unclassified Pseudomonas TaxID=196821 RepID=UPI00111C196A|nr:MULTISPECIES: hypothetical protein [unclassified Pseudomonas]
MASVKTLFEGCAGPPWRPHGGSDGASVRKNRGKTGRHKNRATQPTERRASGKCPCLLGEKTELIFFSFLSAKREIKIPKPLS